MRLIATIVLALCGRGNLEVASLVKEGDAARRLNIDAAIEKYEKASRIEPDNHRIHWKLATAYVTKEDWRKANDTLLTACSLAPTYAMYFFMRGFALEHLGQWADAKPVLEKAIALDPNYPDPEFDLGQVLLKLEDERGAIAHFTKAIQLQPDNAIFYATLADLYFRLGYLDHADKTIAASEPFIAPDDKHRYELFTIAGNIRTEKKDAAGAVTKYEQAKLACGTCTERGQATAYYNLGAAYAALKRKAEAKTNLNAFMKIVCKGAAAQRYADECVTTYELLKSMP
jgi:tetratricopeptide (TPR) repeat protein